MRESYLHADNISSAFVGKPSGSGSNPHFLNSSCPHSDEFKGAQSVPRKEKRKNKSENNAVILQMYLIIDVNRKKKIDKDIKIFCLDSECNALKKWKFSTKFPSVTIRF